MSSDIERGYPGYEKELDALQATYGSEAFTRSILQVYTRDCPAAMKRLLNAIDAGDVEAGRNAIHSLSNIMGVVGPASSRPLIEGISADLGKGQLGTVTSKAKDLEALVKAVLVSIHVWLEGSTGTGHSGGFASKGDA